MKEYATQIVYPDLSYRKFPNAEFYEVTSSIVEVLEDAGNGLPGTDETNREFVGDAAIALKGLGRRMGLDPKGKFTAERQKADRLRRIYGAALKRGVLHILSDPLEEQVGEKRDAAQRLLRIVSLHLKTFSRKNSVQRSAALRLLLPACASMEVQGDLVTTGLLGHYDKLLSAHTQYLEALRKDGLSENEDEPLDDAESATGSGVKPAAPAEELDGAEAVDGMEAEEPLESSRSYRDSAAEALNLTFIVMARHARKEREPYARLLARCAEIIDKVIVLNKSRDTRSKKAKAKKDANATTATQRTSDAAPTAAPRPQEPAKSAAALSN